jgi:hypothetical protein
MRRPKQESLPVPVPCPHPPLYRLVQLLARSAAQQWVRISPSLSHSDDTDGPRPPASAAAADLLPERPRAEALVTGTSKSHQRAPVDAILDAPVVVPPETIAEAFNKICSPLLCRAMDGHRESRVLAGLRDTLLPKLISGEVRLQNVEAFVERVS